MLHMLFLYFCVEITEGPEVKKAICKPDDLFIPSLLAANRLKVASCDECRSSVWSRWPLPFCLICSHSVNVVMGTINSRD